MLAGVQFDSGALSMMLFLFSQLQIMLFVSY